MHMKMSGHFAVFSSFLLLCALVCATGATAQTATNPGQPSQPGQIMQMAAPAAAAPVQAQSACGNQPLCYDTQDFTATITSFLTSTNSANYKIIDVALRFQNKTNQSLVLGYVTASGIALDDRGNRSVVWGPNGYRGIGLVAGTTFDPKFTLRPGGYGDAQFELVLQGWPQLIGFTYVLDLTIAEINSFEGNQHTLGGEFPLHYQGLTNGVGGVSPGYSNGMGAGSSAFANGASLPPCGATGSIAAVTGAANGAGSQPASNAANRVSTAAATISNLGSLFGRKKQVDANAAAAGSPCVPNAAVPATVPAVVPGAVTSAVPAISSTPAASPNVAANAAIKANASSKAQLPAAAANSVTAVKVSATTVNTPTATSAVSTVPAAAGKPAATRAAAPTPAAKPAAPAVTAANPAATPPAKKPAPAKPDPKKPTQK
jgi:hypothetical protein